MTSTSASRSGDHAWPRRRTLPPATTATSILR
jgi:hypothetical protein